MNLNISKFKNVHPDLVRVIKRASTDLVDPHFGFVITCGQRTLEEQKKLLAVGATKTLNSRHIPGKDGYAKAIDLAVTIDGKVKWDWPLYLRLSKIIKAAAKAEKVQIEWGGDWIKFKDGPHFQLPKNIYP